MLAGMLALLGRLVNMFVRGATEGLDGLPAAITSTYCFLAPDTEQHSLTQYNRFISTFIHLL